MKRVKKLDLFNKIKEIREFEYGIFYFFQGGIIISEIKEGVIFKWDHAEKVINAAHKIYGTEIPLIYISNRVNRYYVLPFDWLKFYKNRNNVTHYAAIGQTTGSFVSFYLERLFFPKSIIQFKNLDEAVRWAVKNSSISLKSIMH